MWYTTRLLSSFGTCDFNDGMRVFSFLRVNTVVILMVGCWLSCLTRLSDILPLYCSSHMYGGIGGTADDSATEPDCDDDCSMWDGVRSCGADTGWSNLSIVVEIIGS